MRYVGVLVVVVTVIVGYGSTALAQEAGPTGDETQATAEQEAVAPAFEDEITITGSLIPRPSLDSLSPVTVMDIPQELTLSGTTRIEDLLVSLPQIYPDQNSTISKRLSICVVSVRCEVWSWSTVAASALEVKPRISTAFRRHSSSGLMC
jgi:hypothetical protein